MKRIIRFSVLLLISVSLLCSCEGRLFSSSPELKETTFFAMDTLISVRVPKGTPESVLDACREETERLDAVFSRTDERSVTASINKSAAGADAGEEYCAVLSTALLAAQITEGAFDPTLAPLTELWNITGENPTVPAPDAVAAALAETGYRHLSMNGTFVCKDMPALSIDLGGCAKGYACARAVQLLSSAGVEYGIVSFGGNIGVIGQKEDGSAWSVGVRDPDSRDGIAGILSVRSGFLSVSGDYERYFEEDGVRYHHIFDSNTGYPAQSGVRSAAVWSEDGTLADALSTAVFVMGWEKTMALYESHLLSFEALLYLSDGTTVLTPGFADCYEHRSRSFSAPSAEN